MGVGINAHYVSVWFGQRADKVKVPDVCVDETEAILAGVVATGDQDETVTDNITYYLIFGSFTDVKDAKEAIKRHKKAGFEEAGFIKSDDLTRVFLGKYNSLKEAMYAKQQLPYTYRESWIYKE